MAERYGDPPANCGVGWFFRLQAAVCFSRQATWFFIFSAFSTMAGLGAAPFGKENSPTRISEEMN